MARSEPLRRVARAILPRPVLSRLRAWAPDSLRYDGMASREYKIQYWWDRHVTKRPPVLHRLVVHLTDHCNLNCAGCTHFSNISPKYFADTAEFARDMQRLSTLFSSITEIYLLGGEPLLHPEVGRFVTITRELFPDSRINLMTNGVLGDRVPQEVWEALAQSDAHLVCDLYPVDLPVDEMNAAAERFGATIDWTEPRGEFFRLPIDPAGGHDPADAFARCRWVNNCPILRGGRLYPCAYIAYIDVFKQKFGLDGMEPSDADSVSIHDTDDPYAIMDVLLSAVPWCRHCDFDNLEMRPWARSTRCADEWIGPGTEATPES